MSEQVAVYGTLLSGERNARWGAGAISRRRAFLRGVLYDTGWGYPAFVPEPSAGLVEAEVLEVDSDGLARMDTLESCPQFYRRERIVAALESGGETTAWVYVLNQLPPHAEVIRSGSWRKR